MPIELDIQQLVADLALVMTAFVLALPLAWERRGRERPTGFRTFPIVAVASCAFVLIGEQAFAPDPQAQSRIVQGLMTGIGFIGGGAILRGNPAPGVAPGVATAASIWNTGAIGAAVAYGRFEIAVVLTAVNFLVLRYIGPATEASGEASGKEGGEGSR